MCTRMSMDIRVHIGRNPHDQHERDKFEKTLSTSSLTINAPLIVKDEVDKVFELVFPTKQKSYVGLRLIVIWDPPVHGLEGPRTGGSMITILIE